MALMKKAGRITMSVIGRLKKILKTEHHTSQQSLSPPQESPVAPNPDDEISITMDDQIAIELMQTPEDVSNSAGSFMNIDIDTHATTAGASAAPPPPHPVSVVSIGKGCLAIDGSAIIAWIVVQANSDKVNDALDWVLVGFVISSASILVGIVIRKYKPRAAKFTEQFGICLTFISIYRYASLYLKSKVALVLVMTTGVIVVFVLAVPAFLPVTADEGETDKSQKLIS